MEKGSRFVIWDNRDLIDTRGVRLSLIQSSLNRELNIFFMFHFRHLEVSYYDAQQAMHSFQSSPISITDSWSHLLLRISGISNKPMLSLMEVYLNGKQLISCEIVRRSFVNFFLQRIIICRAKLVFLLDRVSMVVILFPLPLVLCFSIRFHSTLKMIWPCDRNYPCTLFTIS